MRQTLRLLTSASLVATLFLSADAQNVGISRNGAAPNVKAILDLSVSATSGNPFQGMLIPRMTQVQRLAIVGLGAADKGLWVYQTNDGANADPTLNAASAKGYWYYEGVNPAPNDWVRWSAGAPSWRTNGNANTVATTNYLGTPVASNDDLYIRTTNSLVPNPSIRINATDGFVGINLAAAPVERVDVNGGVQVGNTAANNAGSIRHEATLASPNRWHYGNVNGLATGWQRMENAETRYINQAYCPTVQQCGTTDGTQIRGTYAGAALTSSNLLGGQIYTPFATNTGANNRQGFRVQYIYPSADLYAAGLCPGLITKISFYIVGNEGACTPGVNCPDIKMDIRMGNTALTTFGPVAGNQATPLAFNWDAPTEASANINATSGSAFLSSTGWRDFPITGAGFNWTGGNLIIDASWLRNTPIGNSPAVQHETVVGYTSSKWVQVLTLFSPAHGNTYNDNPLPAGAYTGANSTRPVTRFYGKVSSPAYGAATNAAFLNYGGGLMIDDNILPTTWADGAYRGPGTIRASVAVYDGQTVLSDHVFDRYYEGDVKPEDAANTEGYAYVGLPALKEYLEKERHLPSMPSREEWNEHGTPSLGQLQTGLWESVETQALYITQLENDLSSLESLAFGKLKDPAEVNRLIGDVKNSRRLTEAQKLHITNALQARLNANTDSK